MKEIIRNNKIVPIILVLAIVIGLSVPSTNVWAETDDNSYYMGKTQKKDDAGYKEDTDIDSSDVHYGWELGQFCISGYTRHTTDDNGNEVFLKNVGDTVSLSFLLQQDIDMLNNDDEYHISEDDNGYDEYFGITKDQRTNFGKGTLLVKKIDYQNKEENLQPYVNYLEGVKKGANTEIQLFEEGDYEVALDYEIQNNNFHFWGWRPFDGYTHYQILIKFSVRNGNCMVYPFDIKSKSELVNTSFTENGFYLDLANSRYLTIDVKKQNYVESDGSLVEDTRFNKPAKDGEEFSDEGIYIITVRNLYTNAETEKKIYVGSDPILKAYVTTGQDIGYIRELVNEGATIEADGTITLSVDEKIEETQEEENVVESVTEEIEEIDTTDETLKEEAHNFIDEYKKYIVIGSIISILFLYIMIKCLKRIKAKKDIVKDEIQEEEEK